MVKEGLNQLKSPNLHAPLSNKRTAAWWIKAMVKGEKVIRAIRETRKLGTMIPLLNKCKCFLLKSHCFLWFSDHINFNWLQKLTLTNSLCLVITKLIKKLNLLKPVNYQLIKSKRKRSQLHLSSSKSNNILNLKRAIIIKLTNQLTISKSYTRTAQLHTRAPTPKTTEKKVN